MTQTNTSTTMTVRLDTSVKKQLEKAADNQNRSKSYIAAEAISEYLAVQELQDDLVRKAIEQADRGETIPHEAVKKWVASLGTENELPMPSV